MTLQPAEVGYAEWLDWSCLERLSDALPDDAKLVVGIGGGRAIDALKYVALAKRPLLIVVPSAVSTGAIVHGSLGVWEGRKLVSVPDTSPRVDSDDILVNFDLVLEAPYYLNSACLGDILCNYAGLAEWRWNSRLGTAPAWDEAVAAGTIDFHLEVVNRFPQALDCRENLTAESIHFMMNALQERDSRVLNHVAAPSGDDWFLHAI